MKYKSRNEKMLNLFIAWICITFVCNWCFVFIWHSF